MKRRDFLAAAPVAAIAPVMASPAPAAPIQPENPDLLALGAQQPAVEAAYLDACAAWDVMWREWSPQWPLAPEPCTERGIGWEDDRERNLAGAAIVRPGHDKALRVPALSNMEWRRDNLLQLMAKDAGRKRQSSRKTVMRWQAEVRRLELGIELLPGYLAECDRVKRGSNYAAINTARTRAADRLFEFAREVLSVPSTTLDGVAIKARTVAALRHLRPYERRWSNIADIGLHDQNMAALLGQALVDVLTKNTSIEVQY